MRNMIIDCGIVTAIISGFCYQGPLRTFLDLSQKIGGDVATQASLVNAAFQ